MTTGEVGGILFLFVALVFVFWIFIEWLNSW